MIFSPPILLLSLAAFCSLCAMAAYTDLRSYRIPNRISIAVAALYPVFAVAGGAEVRDGLLAGAIVFAVGVFLYGRGWMGGGDVKLLAAVGLWAGTDLVLPMVLVVTVAGGVMSTAEWVRTGGFRRFMGRNSPLLDAGSGPDGAVRRAVVPYAAAILAGAAYVALVRGAGLFNSLETF